MNVGARITETPMRMINNNSPLKENLEQDSW